MFDTHTKKKNERKKKNRIDNHICNENKVTKETYLKRNVRDITIPIEIELICSRTIVMSFAKEKSEIKIHVILRFVTDKKAHLNGIGATLKGTTEKKQTHSIEQY